MDLRHNYVLLNTIYKIKEKQMEYEMRVITERDRIMEKFLTYDTYEGVGDIGVTSLEQPKYFRKLAEEYPDEDCLDALSRLDSRIGTAIHMYAEEAIKDSMAVNVLTEVKLSAPFELADDTTKVVGGTADLIIEHKDGTLQIGDWKSMKPFTAKKVYKGQDIEKYVHQLSLYAYMLRTQGHKVSDTGIIYVIVTGWQKDSARIGRQKGEDTEYVPKFFKAEFSLMNDKEVEEYVKDRAYIPDNQKVDCPVWMCEEYCRLKNVCPKTKNKQQKCNDFKDESC